MLFITGDIILDQTKYKQYPLTHTIYVDTSIYSDSLPNELSLYLKQSLICSN